MFTYATERFRWLQDQLAGGWRLKTPIIERPIYYDADGAISAFEFVLRHERGCQAVVIPDCPELRSFLHDRELDVVML
jgi:hypothetical protein